MLPKLICYFRCNVCFLYFSTKSLWKSFKDRVLTVLFSLASAKVEQKFIPAKYFWWKFQEKCNYPKIYGANQWVLRSKSSRIKGNRRKMRDYTKILVVGVFGERRSFFCRCVFLPSPLAPPYLIIYNYGVQ